MLASYQDTERAGASAPNGPDDRDALDDTTLETYWRTHDPSLREAILKRFEKLIQSLARKFARGDVPVEDLVQIASIGLLGALDRFDPDRGVKFATFAVSTMVGEIKHYFRDHTWGIKIPRYLQEIATGLPRAEEELSLRLGRSPTIPEIAERFGTTEETVLEAMALGRAYHPRSLDTPLEFESEESTDRVQDRMGATDPGIAAVTEYAPLMTALGSLDERKQVIVKRRYFEGWSQTEVARELGISQMHVSRLEREALAELRAVIRAEYTALR